MHCICPLSGGKRTWLFALHMSAYDPKRTFFAILPVGLMFSAAMLAVDEMQYIFSLINDLLEKPTNLSTASKYTAINGLIYLAAGVLFIVWPGSTQTLCRRVPSFAAGVCVSRRCPCHRCMGDFRPSDVIAAHRTGGPRDNQFTRSPVTMMTPSLARSTAICVKADVPSPATKIRVGGNS